MGRTKDFEDFLIQVHAESIQGTDEDCLDDDLIDAFDEWVSELDLEVLIKYADVYGQQRNIDGYKEAVADTNKIWERITAQ
jgi:hypothetical protein